MAALYGEYAEEMLKLGHRLMAAIAMGLRVDEEKLRAEVLLEKRDVCCRDH